MMISWAITGEAGEVIASGTRRVDAPSTADPYHNALSVAEAVERAIIEWQPCRMVYRAGPLHLFEEARGGKA